MVQNNDVNSVLQRYNYDQICGLLNEVESKMKYIEENFRFQNQYAQQDWQAEYQNLEYEREVLLTAYKEYERQSSNSMGVNRGFSYGSSVGAQPINRFQVNRMGSVNNNAPMNYRRVGEPATSTVTQRGFGGGSAPTSGLNRFATQQSTPNENRFTARPVVQPQQNTNTQQGENMLRNEGINLLGSNIPFATEANTVNMENGNIIFKTNVKTNTVKGFDLDVNTELTAGSFTNENGSETIIKYVFESTSFSGLVNELKELYGCEYKTAASMVLGTIYTILDRDMGVLGLDKVLAKNSLFGDEEWSTLDDYVSGEKNSSRLLSELRNFNTIVSKNYKNIYDYIGSYIRASYVVQDNEVVGTNVIEATCKVDETHSFLNFVNKYSNFKNFILPDGVNNVLHNIITAAYNKLEKSFLLKKYNDFLTINLVISDESGYEYAFVVSKRYRPDQGQVVYMLKVCDMYVNVN